MLFVGKKGVKAFLARAGKIKLGGVGIYKFRAVNFILGNGFYR